MFNNDNNDIGLLALCQLVKYKFYTVSYKRYQNLKLFSKRINNSNRRVG